MKWGWKVILGDFICHGLPAILTLIALCLPHTRLLLPPILVFLVSILYIVVVQYLIRRRRPEDTYPGVPPWVFYIFTPVCCGVGVYIATKIKK